MTDNSILAWHFVGATLRDGRPVPADGETLHHHSLIVPCLSGLHASVRVRDALEYAPGSTVCRVKLSGRIFEHGGDKHVASERTVLWRVNASAVVQAFARQCALDVAHHWECPDIVREYLETGREDLRGAAECAASTYAWSAREFAARAALWATMVHTDYAAAALHASLIGDDRDARLAIIATQNTLLTSMIEAEYKRITA